MMEPDIETPFPLAYLDWCKEKGIKSVKETENISLIRQYYKEVWSQNGKEVSGIEYAIARGLL